MSLYPQTPPPGAVKAANEAQTLARQQATAPTKFPGQNFQTRPGGTQSIPQRPQASMVNAQPQWTTPGGRSPTDSTAYVHNQQTIMPPMQQVMRVQQRPMHPNSNTVLNTASRKKQPSGNIHPGGQMRKMPSKPQQVLMQQRRLQQQQTQRPILSVKTF